MARKEMMPLSGKRIAVCGVDGQIEQTESTFGGV
jgi:hypothetical protein